MDTETVIEKSVRGFVFSKIQEQVYLDVSKPQTVTVRHKSKHGSTALAMFWLRVLRHQNNYPMPKYPYKDVYDKQGYNKIILKVDDVTMTTFMSTGCLVIEGVFVIEWFLDTFQRIMDAYDAPITDPQPNSTIYRQYTENWKRLQQHWKSEEEGEDGERRIKEDRALEIADDRTNIISKVSEESPGDTETRVTCLDYADILDRAAKQRAVEMAEELTLMTMDVWPNDVLNEQLIKLRMCSVRDGSTYIYRLWKSLLCEWFTDSANQVYIVTPFLDHARLVDVCDIILDRRITANLEAFYVRQQCDEDKRIFEVKQNALNKFDAKDQMFLEYKIFSRIVYPMKNFNANFIASVKGGEAKVLVTSASFHGNHFEVSSMETVQYQVMSDIDFIRGFISPINSSLQAGR